MHQPDTFNQSTLVNHTTSKSS